ncbi:hypothetical protein [Klebsiella variicola]|uniref:hypothetical protein n=1 Tax=Klebsiella variicola TaxID=244366 RepID=UPI0009BAF44C|nr:hypothetical protein [Klebsiella variicola]SLX01148.1 Uncharacterised protein [Klebsiella variicola]SLX01802.1 Uncharacterised protein [Klebsiella variicola]
MTTDITELAQREKFEAWFVNDVVGADVTFPAFEDGAYAEGEIYDEQFYFMLQAMWMAWKAAGAELVEALEKAQRHANLTEAERQAYLGLISKRDERIAELEQQNSIANEKVTELSRLVQHNISRSEDAERRAERISKSSSLSHPGLLHATNELVLIFSHALADKLYAAQEKYNHGASWRNNDWQEACQRDFQKHIAKGDPRDVAAYCAFMWWHGWSTKPAEGLESSTVTVKLPHQTDFDDPLSAYEAIEKCKEALTAAGIKVETE